MGYQQTLMYGRYSKEKLKLEYYLIRPFHLKPQTV